ncbi:MAG: hypothetical protein GKR87_14160 [Kiritimatiellae bacterium]|nr:hypothetical protein [Kiritimatiellia bacterium]
MQTIKNTIAGLLLVIGTVYGENLVNVSGASGIGLSGYDPVSFFTDGTLTHGDPGIKAKHSEATYFFANKEHKKMFKKNPEKYAPQYGGFCAYGVSVGALFPVDTNTWQIRNDKLYFNLNPKILKIFNKDFDKNVAKASKKWPRLQSKN